MDNPGTSIRCQQELELLLQSRYSLIFLQSREESRAINAAIAAHDACTTCGRRGEVLLRATVEGFIKRSDATSGKQTWNADGSPACKDKGVEAFMQSLLEQLRVYAQESIKHPDLQYTCLLPDWTDFFDNNHPLTVRTLKEILLLLEKAPQRPFFTLIITGANWTIPDTLRDSIHIVTLPLPNAVELHQHIFSHAVKKYCLDSDQAHQLAEQSQGIPLQVVVQSARLFTAKDLWKKPQEAVQELLEIKKQEIKKTGVLEYYPPKGDGLKDVGGLQEIKQWVKSREAWFKGDSHPELRPKGLLLEGYPGCGKSLIARAIAQEWRLPQINFEIARLQNRYVGDSEKNTFNALRAIEASAPNILFMDEIEKAFSGTGSDSSGVTTRQFGTFLSWLNDHNYPILFIATSNNRSALPPELFRAGRFDETFIVMLPNTEERREIIENRLKNYRIASPDQHTLEFLVKETFGFSGAEIDKLVREAIYLSSIPEPVLASPSQDAWANALKRVYPQYKTERMQTLLKNYYNLLNDGAKSASVIEPGFFEQLLNV